MLGFSPTEAGREGADPPPLELPAALTSAVDCVSIGAGKVPVPAPVPEAPPTFQNVSLVGDASGIGADEAYSNDEEQLNNFLRLHPMLSLYRTRLNHKPIPSPAPHRFPVCARREATSQRTLQMLGTMFEKAAITAKHALPVVPKSHDDLFLTAADEKIGERPCVNGDTCLGKVIAQVRYGMNTDKAFVCKEFLLPDQHAKFLRGEGLPQRQGKCLLCSRYFQSYVYVLARTDPAFKVGQSPLGMQVFCNPVTHIPAPKVNEEDNLQRAAAELPTSACSVSAKDGYKPSATLFVDEDWLTLRSARESNMGQLLFKPCVRFCSTHYKYVKDDRGLRIVQVGIGADDSGEGLHFVVC